MACPQNLIHASIFGTLVCLSPKLGTTSSPALRMKRTKGLKKFFLEKDNDSLTEFLVPVSLFFELQEHNLDRPAHG